jgi:hypothetical protein
MKEKELKKEEKREKEAKIMKEFLEDYDDERDDPKYYKLVFSLQHFDSILTPKLLFQRQSLQNKNGRSSR